MGKMGSVGTCNDTSRPESVLGNVQKLIGEFKEFKQVILN